MSLELVSLELASLELKAGGLELELGIPRGFWVLSLRVGCGLGDEGGRA